LMRKLRRVRTEPCPRSPESLSDVSDEEEEEEEEEEENSDDANEGERQECSSQASTEIDSPCRGVEDKADMTLYQSARTGLPLTSLEGAPVAHAIVEMQTLPPQPTQLKSSARPYSPSGNVLPMLQHMAYMSQQMAMLAALQAPAASMPSTDLGVGLRTTVVLQNLPDGFTRDMLLSLLDDAGFKGRYDFAYLPVAFSTMSCLNHCFVNMVLPADAEALMEKLTGQEWPNCRDKVCGVAWNHAQQGLAALVERYRNSPVMHESVPDECKPLLMVNGRRVKFPRPTQPLKAPRILKKHGKVARD